MRNQILRQLKNADGFVSGEVLSTSLGVTRAALWKHIRAMQADGAVIDSATNRGYRLVSAPTLPRAEYVQAYMRRDVTVFFEESCVSTNDTAKAAAQDKKLRCAAFIAGEQTGGKGRKGRVWVSKPGQGVYVTMLVRPDTDPARVSGITLMAAVAVCGAVQRTAKVSPRIKWPNDVLVGGKKVAGILTESMVHMDGVEYVVCGIGINTGAAGFAGELKKTAAAVTVNPTALAAAVIDNFFDAYDNFEKYGLPPFMAEFRERSAVRGSITLSGPGGSVTGEFAGYDDDGAILLRCGGETRRFVAGEVTLRGENGYV